MLAIIYSDSYYIKIIPEFLTIPYQFILMSEVKSLKSLKSYLCVLILSEPTEEVEIILKSFSGCKISIGLKNPSNLYNYIYTHNYNDEKAFIPDLRLLGSKVVNKKLDHCVFFMNHNLPSNTLINLNILKTQLEKRYKITFYSKKLDNFEDLIYTMSTVNCAICLTYESFLAAIVTRTPIYPITHSSRSRDLLEQIGLLSYNYDSSTNIITWYQTLNRVKNDILEKMDRFHKQSLFLFYKHPINRLISLHIHDTRHIIFNVLHHTDDYLNGARLLADFILKDPNSSEIPIIHRQLTTGSTSLIDKINSTTRDLLHKRALIYLTNSIHKMEQGIQWEYLKNQAPHLFTTDLIVDYNIYQTFLEWSVYMIYKAVIPYSNWWAGILTGNCEPLFQKVEFIQSLHRCRFIGVFSPDDAKILKSYLKRLSPHTKIYIFNHL